MRTLTDRAVNDQLPGMCGWTQGITYYGDDENTEFDALQVTLGKDLHQGSCVVTQTTSGRVRWDDQNGYWTWSHSVTHLRDSNVRAQQLVSYGSYDLPFGKGKQLAPNANRVTDLIIGGYQLAYVLNWSGGLPFSVGYEQFDIRSGNRGLQPQYRRHSSTVPSEYQRHMQTSLTSANEFRRHHQPSFFVDARRPGSCSRSRDWIRSATRAPIHTIGPSFFNTDLAITKAFTIHESIVAKFRMDAFNAFNHINAGNPNNTDIFGTGHISGAAQLGSSGTSDRVSLEFSCAYPVLTARGSRTNPGGELRLPSFFARNDAHDSRILVRVKLNSSGQLCFASSPLQFFYRSSNRRTPGQPHQAAAPSADSPASAVTFETAQELAGKGRLDAAMAQLDQLAAAEPGARRRRAACAA